MKRVTRNNLLKLIDWKKEYIEKKEKGIKDIELLEKINNYIDNVINKDNRYYHKLLEYNFTNEQLEYLL